MIDDGGNLIIGEEEVKIGILINMIALKKFLRKKRSHLNFFSLTFLFNEILKIPLVVFIAFRYLKNYVTNSIIYSLKMLYAMKIVSEIRRKHTGRFLT
jgi:hypothetical protein